MASQPPLAPHKEQLPPSKGKQQMVGVVAVSAVRQAAKVLPNNDAYLTALDQCMHLIESESDPMSFLRCCDCDVDAAASRLVAYWTLRYETFGPDRCYRPVGSLSGHDALSQKSVRIVRTGVAYLLPMDRSGHVVLYFDRINFRPARQHALEVSTQDKLEASFYHFHTVAMQLQAQTTGFVILNLITERTPKVYPKVTEFASRACRECFPIRLVGVRLVCAPLLKESKHTTFVSTILPFLWQCVSRPFAFTRRSIDMVQVKGVTKSTQKQNLAKHLADKIGLTELPPAAGGTWSYQCYCDWYNGSIPPTSASPSPPDVVSPLQTLARVAEDALANT